MFGLLWVKSSNRVLVSRVSGRREGRRFCVLWECVHTYLHMLFGKCGAHAIDAIVFALVVLVSFSMRPLYLCSYDGLFWGIIPLSRKIVLIAVVRRTFSLSFFSVLIGLLNSLVW